MSSSDDVGYPTKVRHIYGIWRSIKPRIASDKVNPWANFARHFLLQEGLVVPELSQWELLKASWTLKHHHKRGRFVWQMAGRQLQAVKALAVRSRMPGLAGPGDAVPIVVIPNMYAALKPDNTYIKRLMAREDDEDDGDYDGNCGDRDCQRGGLDELAWMSSQLGEELSVDDDEQELSSGRFDSNVDSIYRASHNGAMDLASARQGRGNPTQRRRP